jgi:ferredoxin
MSIAGKVFREIFDGENPRPSLDKLLEIFDKELENFNSLLQSSPESKPRTPFDSPHLPVEKMSIANMSRKQFLAVMPIMLPLLLRMRKSSKLYDGKFQPTHSEATLDFIKKLESMGRAAGAKDIKYVKVPRNAIFQRKGIPHEYAIIFTVEMDQGNISTAPSYEAFREVAKGYKNLAVIGNKLAQYLRKNGFAAYPGTALGGITDYTYLSELAGLGAIGYHGLLITPGEGARLRINTIYTNITNLPIETKNKHLWIRDFCAMCKKCIRECPVKAIFDQPVPRGDGGMQCIHHDICRDFFNQNFGCAICLAACPFSQTGYEKVKLRFKGNPKAPLFRIPVEPF